MSFSTLIGLDLISTVNQKLKWRQKDRPALESSLSKANIQTVKQLYDYLAVEYEYKKKTDSNVIANEMKTCNGIASA